MVKIKKILCDGAEKILCHDKCISHGCNLDNTKFLLHKLAKDRNVIAEEVAEPRNGYFKEIMYNGSTKRDGCCNLSGVTSVGAAWDLTRPPPQCMTSPY